MQLSLLTHIKLVWIMFIVGIAFIVLPIIFFILKKKKKNQIPMLDTLACFLLICGIVFCVPMIYYAYLNGKYDVSEYTNEDILYVATANENEGALNLMLKRGSDPSANTRFGSSSMYKAVEIDNYDFVKIFLENGADPNEAYGEYTPLGVACRNQNYEMCELLLLSGAVTDYKPEVYVSALSCAAAYDEGYNYPLIKLLCDNGANRQAVSITPSGRKMVPFKYYFSKSKNIELSEEDQANYDKIAELLEDDYRKWVMENTNFSSKTDEGE